MPFSLRVGQRLEIHRTHFVIQRRFSDKTWQLENIETGEFQKMSETDVFALFENREMEFVLTDERGYDLEKKLAEKLKRDLQSFPEDLVEIAKLRQKYMKAIDRAQPVSVTKTALTPIILSTASELGDSEPLSPSSACRLYPKWRAADRDIRILVPDFASRGNRTERFSPEVVTITNNVIKDLYLKSPPETVPEVHQEIGRRVSVENEFREETDKLRAPSLRTVYRVVDKVSPYQKTRDQRGQARADMDFRVSLNGPPTSRPLERVVMDHTLSDSIVVDDETMLPLGRPWITTALDEHTRSPLGLNEGFEPPSVLCVSRCLKHAILPKLYLREQYPTLVNEWECYGQPELLIVDNPPEFHSLHFERACLQLGIDIQYAKAKVPYYKAKIERWQGRLNHEFLHRHHGTTFSNIFERDDYDPAKNAVIRRSTFRESTIKWNVDIYQQTVHRGIKDTPAHAWNSFMSDLPAPLPRSIAELDIVLGMTFHRSLFHYGIDHDSIRYNSPDLAPLRRRLKRNGMPVEGTFDPGDLGVLNVFDPFDEIYIPVPALNQAYAKGLTLWQHRVIQKYARREMKGRTDLKALAEAKEVIRKLVRRDFEQKSTRLRSRQTRFLSTVSKNVPGTEPDAAPDQLAAIRPNRGLTVVASVAPPSSEKAGPEKIDDEIPDFAVSHSIRPKRESR